MVRLRSRRDYNIVCGPGSANTASMFGSRSGVAVCIALATLSCPAISIVFALIGNLRSVCAVSSLVVAVFCFSLLYVCDCLGLDRIVNKNTRSSSSRNSRRCRGAGASRDSAQQRRTPTCCFGKNLKKLLRGAHQCFLLVFFGLGVVGLTSLLLHRNAILHLCVWTLIAPFVIGAGVRFVSGILERSSEDDAHDEPDDLFEEQKSFVARVDSGARSRRDEALLGRIFESQDRSTTLNDINTTCSTHDPRRTWSTFSEGRAWNMLQRIAETQKQNNDFFTFSAKILLRCVAILFICFGCGLYLFSGPRAAEEDHLLAVCIVFPAAILSSGLSFCMARAAAQMSGQHVSRIGLQQDLDALGRDCLEKDPVLASLTIVE